MDDHIFFQFAVYCLPPSTADPLRVLDSHLKDRFTAFRRVGKLDSSPSEMTIAARLEENVEANYAPPNLEYLPRFGRGLSGEQAQKLQETNSAVVMDFGIPKEQLWEGLRAAHELAEALARQMDGLIWDDQTREVFTTDAWKDKRLSNWTEVIPDVSDHTVIHAYNTGKHVRAITLGMSKFGLPDVVVDGFSWSLNRNMGHLINLFAQAMAEGAMIRADGEFDLDLNAIQNSFVREPQVAALKPNAIATAMLRLKKGVWEDGDPHNRLIEIVFDRYEGPDIYARQENLLGELFGWEDAIKPVTHDDELLAASQRAKAKMAELRSDFVKGLAPGEYIMVKAPFDTPDGGHEWMWVEVMSWNKSAIRGLLKSEPYNIPDLHGGQEVDVAEDEVFDYIRRLPDGTQEGNETGEIIRRQSEDDM